jgi:hypothetical protein
MNVEEAQTGMFVSTVGPLIDLLHSSRVFWTEALGLAPRFERLASACTGAIQPVRGNTGGRGTGQEHQARQ